MLGTRNYLPNRSHALNVGKVAWLLCLPGQDNPSDLLTGQFSRLRFCGRNGFPRPGNLGAQLRDTAATGGCNLGIHPAWNNLPNGSAGFSVAFWFSPPATSPSSVTCCCKGDGSTAGWSCGVSGTGALTLALARATTDESYASSATVGTLVGGSGAPGRVLWSWTKEGTAALYVNGFKFAVTATAGSGAYVSDATTELHLAANSTFSATSGGINCGPMDDLCLWSRALSAPEAYDDYRESATGYPGALMQGPLAGIFGQVLASGSLLRRRSGRKAWKREPVFDYWRRGAP